MDLVRHFEEAQMAGRQLPQLRAGDVVRLSTKVQEGDKERLQVFEGTVLGIRGSGPSASVTIRRETGHFGVERIFPLYSPLIHNIEIVRRQKVRRAKLTYLRQEGRRRFKEDVRSMQRHTQAEDEKKRLAAAAEKKKLVEEEAAQKAEEKAKEEQKAEAEKKNQTEEASAETPKNEEDKAS